MAGGEVQPRYTRVVMAGLVRAEAALAALAG
jgi:hypothetical protein